MSKTFIMNPVIQFNINIINFHTLSCPACSNSLVHYQGCALKSNTWITPVIKVSHIIQNDKKFLCTWWL